jgi:hypothetical protein
VRRPLLLTFGVTPAPVQAGVFQERNEAPHCLVQQATHHLCGLWADAERPWIALADRDARGHKANSHVSRDHLGILKAVEICLRNWAAKAAAAGIRVD